jgi:Cu(I)/Ag(I) efflux system membrane protein CusA/SilA
VNGTPIYVKDVAAGPDGWRFPPRRARSQRREVVGGIVVMRTGMNAMEVIRAVKEKIAQITRACHLASAFVPSTIAVN